MWNDSAVRRGRQSVFRPSGQVGLVCDGRSACLSVIGPTAFVVVSTLRQFTVYDAFALRVSFVSLPLLCEIAHIATRFEHVFVVLGTGALYAFHRYDQRRIENRHSSGVLGIVSTEGALVTFSCNEVIAYSQSGGGTVAADADVGELDNRSQDWSPSVTTRMPDGFKLDVLLPLAGFKNKVLLGSCSGEVRLCNIATGNFIHTFQFPESVLFSASSDGAHGISAAVQSQLKSNAIVAVGYRSGDVLVADIKGDQSLGSFRLSKQQQHATAMAFAYDAAGVTLRGASSLIARECLLVGAANGDIVIFDLTEFRTFSVVEHAHVGPVRQLMYIEKSNHIVTAGTDNALVLWAMDCDKHLLREFKSRRGLIGEINLMSTYDTDEMDLLVASSSGGSGYLGKASTIQQLRCTNFSTGASKHRIKRITAVATCYQRHYDWPNIATCHQGTHVVHLWSGHRQALVEGVLRVPGVTVAATAVCISSCGNFVAVGYGDGQLHLFNLQSTNHEDEFVVKRGGDRAHAHSGCIITLSLMGGTHLTSISSSSHDRSIRSWDLSSISLRDSYEPDLPKGTNVQMATCGSLLTALACSDGVIRLVDVVGKNVIRTIEYGSVTSMSFHPNGSWFIANGRDSTMVIYDILAACYVEYAKFAGNVLAVNIDSSGAFLNVAVDNAPGMVLRYANKHVFEISARTMLYKELGSEPVLLQLPCILSEVDPAADAAPAGASTVECASEDAEMHSEYRSTAAPLGKGLISLSGLSSGRLQSVLFLDEIKEKSKPLEPPKAAAELPFFIPTTYKEGQLVFVEPEANGAPDAQAPRPKGPLLGQDGLSDEFERLLLAKESKGKKYEDIMAYLLSQTPSGVHVALSLLSEERKGEALLSMLKFFEYHQSRKTQLDALQVFLHVFLRYHGEAVSSLKLRDSGEVLDRLGASLQSDGRSLQDRFDRLSCFIKFFTHLQME